MAERIFQRGGFRAPNVTRSGNNILRFTAETGEIFGFRSNDDTLDIISFIQLEVNFDLIGGSEPGGIHPDHAPKQAETEYSIRFIGDSRGINTPILDIVESDLSDPGLYTGYDKSRIIFKMVTSSSGLTHPMSINRTGNTYRVDYGLSSANAALATDVSDDTPTVLDCSRLIPKGIKSVGIFGLDFQTGAGGAITDSLQMTTNGIDGPQLVQQDVNMPQVVLGTYTRLFDDILVNDLSQALYQVTDASNNLASIQCFGYERSIGRDS